MKGNTMHNDDLDAIEAWGQSVADEEGMPSSTQMLFSYTDALPTHSVRSQMLTLVAEVRALRARVASEPTDEQIDADKLRFIADYVSECDSLIGQVLRALKQQGRAEITDEQLVFVAGTEVQRDLRRWADQIDARAVSSVPQENPK